MSHILTHTALLCYAIAATAFAIWTNAVWAWTHEGKLAGVIAALMTPMVCFWLLIASVGVAAGLRYWGH